MQFQHDGLSGRIHGFRGTNESDNLEVDKVVIAGRQASRHAFTLLPFVRIICNSAASNVSRHESESETQTRLALALLFTVLTGAVQTSDEKTRNALYCIVLYCIGDRALAKAKGSDRLQ